MGPDGSRQPGDLKESQRLVVTAPARDWEETVEGFGARLEAACDYINGHYEAEGLCRELPGAYSHCATTAGGSFAIDPRRATRHGLCERKTARLIIIIIIIIISL